MDRSAGEPVKEAARAPMPRVGIVRDVLCMVIDAASGLSRFVMAESPAPANVQRDR